MYFLAIRHLLSRKRQTLLTLMGIILGTAAYVTISGVMWGFQSFIIDQLVNNDSHIRISAREESLTETSLNESFFGKDTLVNWIKPPSGRKDNPYILAPNAWADRLIADDSVFAFSPQFVVQAIATYGKVSVAVRAIGSEPDKQIRISTIQNYMLKGKFTDIGTTGNRIAIGEGLLNKLGCAMNETIRLTVGKSSPLPFRVVGVFRLGVKTLDDTTIFASLNDIQKLNQTPSRISDIAIRLFDVQEAAAKAASWNLMSVEKVQSWDQANEGIMSVFKTQDITRNFMTISILVVAGFGIYNILSLAVNHKRREIAILRSMGFEPKDIIRLFLTQGIILGFIGGCVGALLGLLISFYISMIEVSPNRGLGSGTMMVSFTIGIYLRAIALALASSSFAGYLPARAAGKLEPIDIIRSENS